MAKILYICSSWPHGRTFGGQLRALHIGRALKKVGTTSVCMVGSEAGDWEAAEKTAAEFEVLPPVHPQASPNRSVSQKARWALDSRYMNLHGYVASADDRARLDSLATQFDLIWVLNSRTPNILQRWQWPRAHLDLDDVPSTYLRTVAESSPRAVYRWKARVQQRLLRRRELLLKQRFTSLSVCSQPDRDYLGGGDMIHVIPNGFARPASEPMRRSSPDAPRIGFIGLYSYPPNVEGVNWFLKECWPAIQKAVPGVRLRLIGRDTDGPLRPTDANVDALGWVEDPSTEIATWSAMIIPIHLGGGTRIKVAEAFSRKCPAVSTTLGAFGYEVTDGQQLRIADKAEDFSRACIELVKHPARAAELAERAWAEFLTKWTWDAIAPKVWTAAEDCMRRTPK